ncbi:MAG: VOC family protein [Chloroflexi bacterium]|nr:VOC family protein [Chloroflexota bacterium]MCH8115585.1 VOC family protein [Chloroflexota bacterium]MCI0852575.1 VOC family protein [Chloroflexota bacterium]
MADLFQVIIVANNVGRLVKFYRDVLGFAVTYPESEANLAQENWVTLKSGACQLAIHGGGEVRTSGSVILSIKVDDLDFAAFDLKEKGFDVEPIYEVAPGVKSAKLRDPEGNRLSLEQHS